MNRIARWLRYLQRPCGLCCVQRIITVSIILSLLGCQPQLNSSSLSQNSTNNSQKAAAINVQLGIGYLQQGYPERAKSKLLLALEEAPHWPPSLDAMAFYLEITGESGQADDYYRQAIRRAPHDGSSHNNYGTYLCRKGEYALAIDQFMRAVKDPLYLDTAKAYENAGLCALKMPNDTLANQFFIKALRLDPRRDTSMLELANLRLKASHFEEGNRYITTYLQTTQPDAQGLWIALQLARHLRDAKRVSQYENALKKQFPLEYKKIVNTNSNQ
jgi:type IV pilus assembly protein PilF